MCRVVCVHVSNTNQVIARRSIVLAMNSNSVRSRRYRNRNVESQTPTTIMTMKTDKLAVAMQHNMQWQRSTGPRLKRRSSVGSFFPARRKHVTSFQVQMILRSNLRSSRCSRRNAAATICRITQPSALDISTRATAVSSTAVQLEKCYKKKKSQLRS